MTLSSHLDTRSELFSIVDPLLTSNPAIYAFPVKLKYSAPPPQLEPTTHYVVACVSVAWPHSHGLPTFLRRSQRFCIAAKRTFSRDCNPIVSSSAELELESQ